MNRNKAQNLTINESTQGASVLDNADLTAKTRDDLPDTDFALPGRRYPLPDEAHGKNALARVAQHGTAEEKAKVTAAVKKKFPGIVVEGKDEKPKTNSSLVVNEDGFITNQFEEITFNLDSSNRRNELLEGRNYTVVPTVMITEGVHAGSNGPLYYPANELSKTPAVWDHKPLVSEHPVENGQAISACSPAVISRRKFGLIMNTRYIFARKGSPGKLVAEAWIERTAANRVDNRILKAVDSGKMVEVSTGLFCDNEKQEGIWKKERYEVVARNYRPDHLAILLDDIGSCSIADGAGLNRNSRGTTMSVREKYVNELIANSEIWSEDDRADLSAMTPPAFAKTVAVHNVACEEGNEITVNFKKAGSGQDVIDDPEGDDNGETVEDAKSMIAPKKGGKTYKGTKNKGTDVTDKTLPAQTAKEKAASESNAGDAGSSPNGKGVMNQRQNNEPLTLNEYINNAPDEIREVLEQGILTMNAKKAELIRAITANRNNTFAPNFLATMPVEQLSAIAKLAGAGSRQSAPVANYLGAGSEANSQIDPRDDEPLGVPVMNFSKRTDA